MYLQDCLGVDATVNQLLVVSVEGSNNTCGPYITNQNWFDASVHLAATLDNIRDGDRTVNVDVKYKVIKNGVEQSTRDINSKTVMLCSLGFLSYQDFPFNKTN